jgi:hypothetical protein
VEVNGSENIQAYFNIAKITVIKVLWDKLLGQMFKTLKGGSQPCPQIIIASYLSLV